MLLVHITYEKVSDESAAEGEPCESGFVSQDEPMTFRELVEWMEGGEPSRFPTRGLVHDWVTQDQGETHEFYEEGLRESRSIHYSKKNPERKAKYWTKAMRLARLAH